MKIVVLSDCHIGSPECNSDAVLKFLSSVQCNRVVFAGDLWDYWETTDQQLRKEKETKNQIFQLTRRGIQVEYVLGNHDEDYLKKPFMSLEILPVVKNWEYVSPGGKKIKIIHGHEFDKIYKRHHFLYKLSAMVNATAGRVLGISLKTLRKTCTDSRGTPEYGETVNEIHDDVRRYYGKRGYDAVIMGHTHSPILLPKTEKRIEFANAGDWKYNNSYLIIDGDDISLRFLNSK